MSSAKKKTKQVQINVPLTQSFLVEIGTEELPPKSLKKLAEAFLVEFHSRFLTSGLASTTKESEVFFSPRRIAIRAYNVLPNQPDRVQENLGPPVAAAFDDKGEPTLAAKGFAARFGALVKDLERKTTDKGDRLAYTFKVKGKPATELLPEIITQSLSKLPIGKRMRWGTGTAEFVRPVHWVLMLLGDKVLKTEILGEATGNKTYGHRFHHPAAITIKSPDDYPKLLEKVGKVRVEDRHGSLAKEIGNLVNLSAARAGGKAHLDSALLEEVAALVEYPVPFIGDFDERFLALPEEVIIAVLQGQQRYFPVRSGAGGQLIPHFIAIANIQSKSPKEVKSGNERVIVPRLTDAMFFWNLDKGTQLDARIEDLETMVFQKELGSYANKQKRVGALAEDMARRIGSDPTLARRAAALAKCDLLSNLVGEFPELQGSIGMHIARVNNENPEVARAIDEHYRPRFALDELPDTKTGQALAIADKLDTLCGIFAIGQKPTGDKDPFALRRAALGIMRILVRDKLDLDLVDLIKLSLSAQPVKFDESLATEIYEFLLDRLRFYYLEQGIRHDVFEAVKAKQPRRPLDFQHRVHAVNEFLKLPEATALAAANKRIANILRQAGGTTAAEAQPELFKLPAENALYEQIRRLRGEVDSLTKAGDYAAALKKLAALRAPVDAFFDQVMVMDPDPAIKANRLALLASLSALFLQTADLSLIQVD